jgi:LPS sulfotransferase NodH
MTRRQPLLVIGAGRSGTTLLAACLSGHTSIEMAVEFGARAFLMGEKLAPERPDTLPPGVRLAAFRSACDSERARTEKPIWGNKVTTEQIGSLEQHNSLNTADLGVASEFAAVMHDYSIIFICRDGRSCAASKVRRAGVTVEEAVARWRYGVSMLRRLRSLGRVNIVVTFEDLVRTPEPTLRAICQALDLDFDPAMLRQTRSPLQRAMYWQDGFDSTRAELPQLPAEQIALMRSDLDYCGYP